jgi:hypothetical protein
LKVDYIKTITFFIFTFLLVGCASKQSIKTTSKVILIKTPTMKYHDSGFISYYDDYIHLQLLNIGNVVLDLSIYKKKICKSTFECIDSNEFNNKYFNHSYKSDFLYTLFKRKKIYFKDKKNKILIKVH